MTDDAARRERALATMDEILPDADMDWADAQEIRSDYGLGFLVGYLAGSREEAAIWDQELKATISEFIADAALRHQKIEKLNAEITELREELKDARSQITGLEYELMEVQEGES